MEFITINKNQELYYGGKQGWWREDNHVFAEYGCGVISMCNMEISLSEKYDRKIDTKEVFFDINNIDYEEYRNYVNNRYKDSYYFSRYKFLSRLGLLPWTMKRGLKSFMSRFGIKAKIKWAPTLKKKFIMLYIEEMLKNDIPITASYFVFLRSRGLDFYVYENSKLLKSTSCTSHYFNIVDIVNMPEINDKYFVVSSWGNKYYVKADDWVNRLSVFSNILYCEILLQSKCMKDII